MLGCFTNVMHVRGSALVTVLSIKAQQHVRFTLSRTMIQQSPGVPVCYARIFIRDSYEQNRARGNCFIIDGTLENGMITCYCYHNHETSEKGKVPLATIATPSHETYS
jgi:hypothetical protein